MESKELGDSGAEGRSENVSVTGLPTAAVQDGVEATQHLVDTTAKAWINVFGAFVAMVNSWGVINSWGSFQAYYTSTVLSSYSQSDVAWIGSVQTSFVFSMGLLVGPLYDRGYFRLIMVTGFLFTTLGLFMASLASTYWQIFLAQALCVGIGVGFTFVASVTCVATWFKKRRALSQGIAASGSSFGGVIYPIMVNNLFSKVGFAWTVRAMALLVTGTQLIPLLVMRPRFVNRSPGKFLDLAAFKERTYVLFVIGLWFGFWGLFSVFFYIQDYAALHRVDHGIVPYVLPIINAASTAGRIIPNFVADRLGAINVLSVGMCLTGVLIYVWLAATSTGGIVAFCIVFGFVSGSFVSLPPAALASLATDVTKTGRRVGQGFALVSIALLTGTPTAGALMQSGGFTAMACWAGSVVLVGSCFAFGSRMPLNWRFHTKASSSDR